MKILLWLKSVVKVLFFDIDGAIVEYDLLPDQQIIIDTEYLVMIDSSCTIEIQNIIGIKNKFLKGEGFLIQLLLVLVKLFLKQCQLAMLLAILFLFHLEIIKYFCIF